ncbi:MAG: PHP domain-containing protein [Candidatus Rokuibacteriota bacterium]|nr:MAG: PHP domain-containing protein [Candidatus Rokubacteria bacterium]
MTGGVDLHAHTTASDGTLSPRELVSAAARRGVRVLAVTDHDSTDGLRDAFDEAAKHPPLTIVPGLEINCDAPGAAGAEVHVLGYYVDHEAGWFQDFLREQRVERVARVHRIVARLAELGMPIDAAEVFAIVKEGSAGRPHVAQVMVQRGYVRSVREAFDRYLHANGPANVPRKRLTPAEAVRIIRRAHGVPVFAHPGLADRDALIPELVEAGLMGIEAIYAEHSAAQTAHYKDVCRAHGLVATGGSDYHGERSGRTNPLGHPPVPMSVWEELKAAAEKARAA